MTIARRMSATPVSPPGWLLLLVLPLCLAVSPAAAQTEPQPGREPDAERVDPLAWRRIDPAARDEALTVVDRSTGRTRQVMGRQLLQDSQEMYLPSATTADLLQASRLWQAVSRRLTLRVGENDFRFVEGSRLVSLAEREILLPVPILYAAGDLWLPLVFVTTILSPEAGLFVQWQAPERQLMLGQAEVNVTELRISEQTRATSLHLLCREPLSFRASSPEAGLIEVKLYGGQADLGRVRLTAPRGLIRSVRAAQLEGHALISVRVDELVTRYRTTTLQEGREIVLVVEEEQIAALPEPVPRGTAELALGAGPIDVTRRLSIRTVVVDPGHGGTDPGVAGRDGVLEKDINLAVGSALADHLRRQGLHVVLTRQDDRHLGLAERAEIANTAGGDLFISLHCNGWHNQSARGLETYFLSPAMSDWSKSVETVENRGHGAPEDVEFIVWDLVQNRYISASSDLAEVVQAEACRALGITDRGVRQAGFRVLVGAWMPAILVEMGFLTHPEESRLLRSERYQRTLARALGDAILVYRDRVAQATGAMSGEAQR